MSPNCKRLLAAIKQQNGCYKHGFTIPEGYRLVGFRKTVQGDEYLGIVSGRHIMIAGKVNTNFCKLVIEKVPENA